MTSALVLSKPRFHIAPRRTDTPDTIEQYCKDVAAERFAEMDRIEKVRQQFDQQFEKARLAHDVEACSVVCDKFNRFIEHVLRS